MSFASYTYTDQKGKVTTYSYHEEGETTWEIDGFTIIPRHEDKPGGGMVFDVVKGGKVFTMCAGFKGAERWIKSQ